MLINFFRSAHKYLFLIRFKTTTTTNWTPDGPGAFTNAFGHLLQNSAPISLQIYCLKNPFSFPVLESGSCWRGSRRQTALETERVASVQEAAAPEITRPGRCQTGRKGGLLSKGALSVNHSLTPALSGFRGSCVREAAMGARESQAPPPGFWLLVGRAEEVSNPREGQGP